MAHAEDHSRDPLGLARFLERRVRDTETSAENRAVTKLASRRGASQPAPGTSAPRVHHRRISRRRHFLLRSRNLKVRPKFKDVKREVKLETIKLKHAVMERASKRETIKL